MTGWKQFFSREDAKKGLIKIEDEALWKNEYVKRVSALLTKLATNTIAVTEDALPFQNWGQDIPSWDTILPAQKKILDSGGNCQCYPEQNRNYKT